MGTENQNGSDNNALEHIVDVDTEWEIFIDILLVHTQENKCTHSIMDLLDEFFSKRVNRLQNISTSSSETDRSEEADT